MDGDILEGLPTTEELSALDETKDAATPVTEAKPAAPVDAASIEPEPQTVAPAVATKEPEPTPVEKPVIAKEREEAAKPPLEEKSATNLPTANFQIPDGPRVDVSAATVTRMMGIASVSDLRVLEGRIDLLTSKVAAILTKVDRCLSSFASVPTASDIGRLEVQLAAVKTMMKELFDSVGAPVGGGKERADRDVAAEQSKKLREGIKTNTES